MKLSVYTTIVVLGLFVALGVVSVRPADALIDTHDCSFCHDFHGAINTSGLLKYSSTEVLCLSCHSMINGSTDAATVHNPANLASDQQGYITCRECHNPHDNIDGNIKLVGYKYDPSTNQSFTTPKVREELTTSDPASPVFKDVVFANNTTEPLDYYRSSASGANGICQACHSNNHLIGKDCISCHNHREDFANADPLDDEGFPATGDCTYCHTGTGTDSAGQYSFDAYNVGPTSSHVKINGATPFNACTDCHPSHTQTPGVVVPNNPTVEIFYTANGESGIGLGGTETSGTTEAEICWNCHGNGQSEWNGQAYNGFTVTGGENWRDVIFDSPGSLIPNRPTRSMHTVNDVDSPDAGLSEVLTDVRSSSVADNVDSNGEMPSSTYVTTSNSNDEILEQVKYIRCSYCHDVHDTVAGSPTKGDTITAENGQVFSLTYLRGSWLPNPYNGTEVDGTANAPEIPPWDQGAGGGNTAAENNGWYYSDDGLSDATNVDETTTSITVGSLTHNNWGHQDRGNSGNPYRSLPRLFATSPGSNRMGGFFIDQNVGWPTRKSGNTYWSATEAAGLCLLCHDEGTNSLDYYQDASSLWRGSNGHSNSTVSGTGSAAFNIFNARRDLADTDPFGMHGQPIPDTKGDGRQWGDSTQTFSTGNMTPKSRLPFGQGFNNLAADDNGGSDYTPPFSTGWYDESGEGGKARESSATGNFDGWYLSSSIGVDGDGNGGTSDRAHNFSCSKCHTPHASGLPALLITNCLDYQLADWFTYGNSTQTDNIVVGPTATNTWARRVMGNCHRKEDNSTGWNKLAAEQ